MVVDGIADRGFCFIFTPSHEGEECGSIIQGTMKIIIGDRAYTLKTVDSIYFKSTVPHKWENVGEEEILGFWAVSPPSF